MYGPNGEKYKNDDAEHKISSIGISILKDSNESKVCEEDFYSTIHVSGKMKDGRTVMDTRATANGLPLLFRVGEHEVLECLDLAITKLK